MVNVHIVCVDDGHIVPRMARWLADAHDWTMSDRPDNGANCNLYMPYTAIAQGIADTPTAAWFTHYEAGNAGKALLWRQAAQKLSLRLTATDLYLPQLAATGPAAKITPGVDREHFTTDDEAPVTDLIGVSGLGSARKGVELAQRLYADGYDVRAAGSGWGLPDEQMIVYEAMPDYYRLLDVYLCTALVEGIPAPPLEALACGTKVVLPRGVGMLDELPEAPGVRHYTAGDYDDMRRAVDEALADEAGPDELRALTEGYSIAAWCDSYHAAITDFVEGA